MRSGKENIEGQQYSDYCIIERLRNLGNFYLFDYFKLNGTPSRIRTSIK
jgi:hypothetical protein